VLAADGAAEADRHREQLLRGGVGPRALLLVPGRQQERRVQVAVTGMPPRAGLEPMALADRHRLLDRVGEAIEETLAIGARHRLEACSWGHAGDGNLHSTFLLTPGDEDEARRASAAAEDLFATAIRLGGTVSGEHGLGILKNGQLSRQWAPAAVELHRAVKRALDPKGLLNPGKKVP